MNITHLLKAEEKNQFIGDTTLLDTPIVDLCYDARKAQSGMVFFALQGRTLDGSLYIPQAYKNGSRIFVAEKIVDVPKGCLLVVVPNARKALSYASHMFINKPSERVKVIGVTGTKGKTTTTTLLYKIVSQSGLTSGVIGTNGAYFLNHHIPTSNTTPESYDIHKILNVMANHGVTTCFIEVSSQGLMMHRVDDVAFEIGVFTNMAHDHISDLEHPTFEDYLYWKTHLFTLTRKALVNNDDTYVNAFTTHPHLEIYTYAIEKEAVFKAENVALTFEGMTFELNGKHIVLNVPGKFNVYNALVVLGVCQLLGGNMDKCCELLASTSVSGRMERIENSKGVMAILDYAHNGFALENVLKTLQQYAYNRLIVLFGSIGERSQNRRLELGNVVAKYADVAIVTSDNPGKEDPKAIIDDILVAFEGFDGCVYTFVDRQQAIQYAASMVQENDIIVFAGKGHEKYQLIGEEKVPFDEKEIIINAFLNGKTR